jgi:ABC-type amino acid transport system permease subunit
LPFATRSLVNLLQSSPVVLLLILAYYLATAVLNFDAAVALSTAIAVLGLSNGANAGSAMADAAETLIQESPGTAPPTIAVLRRSATQVTGFAVNAARGSALASFIGTPELLTALTDIASVSSERKTTYAILLLFYVGIVGVVVWISGALVRRFGTAEAGA